MIRLTTTFLAAALMAAGMTVAFAQDDAEQPKPARQSWSFSGLFGEYDQEQLQRGFEVYKEVCSNCHRLSIPFRALEDPYGPGYSVDQVKALAASYQVTNDEPNDKGEIFKRPGTPADIFPPPDSFPNDQAAAAALGKAPPDMAELAKARKYERGFPWFIFDALPFDQYQEMGADYIYAILTGQPWRTMRNTPDRLGRFLQARPMANWLPPPRASVEPTRPSGTRVLSRRTSGATTWGCICRARPSKIPTVGTSSTSPPRRSARSAPPPSPGL